MMFAVFLPAFDPELISFEIAGFPLALRWYALSYVAGFLVAWVWFIAMMKRRDLWPGEPPMDKESADRLLTWVIIGAVLGGRIGYALFYQPQHYLQNPLEIFAVWQGGMSFHGGFTGLVLATIAFCRVSGAPVVSVGDAVAVCATPGLVFGRVANFINGELWGEPSRLPWAVVFPDGPAAYCPLDWSGVCSRHPSQLYEAILEGVLLCGLLAWLAYRRNWFHVPGQTFGLFFAGYGAARIFAELFRVPDAQLMTADNPAGYAVSLGSFGLSMGQALSIPMVLIGVTVIILARRRVR